MENVFENKVSGKIWNTALYIRLSREDGDKMESESVKSQREMLRNFLLKNPDLKLNWSIDCFSMLLQIKNVFRLYNNIPYKTQHGYSNCYFYKLE